MKAFPQAKRVVALTQAQCASLAALAAKHGVGNGQRQSRLELQQTYTKSGGTHLYVDVGGHEYIVRANGDIADMGAP